MKKKVEIIALEEPRSFSRVNGDESVRILDDDINRFHS